MIAVLPQLRRFAYGLTGSIPDGDDLVQATCERAIANLDKWEIGTRLDSWMYRIAQNLHRNALRDSASRARKLQALGDELEHSSDGRRDQENRATLQAVRHFVERLPEDQRTIMLLVCVEGRSYKDVAAITGLPVGTVTSRLGRARAALREHLSEGPPAAGEEAPQPDTRLEGGVG
ncbi:RNA polymerase sigma factor [Pelagibius marinus]|uniref:RNA polymerase sigma factor n=1 Tax=Pelagibius marinus TaxID=2762760 RepID=UPI0018733EAB|nr:RNA polymerase sigma factor [Pelagibius marinus]